MEIYDKDNVPVGLEFARKLHLDADRFKCTSKEGCSSVVSGLQYEELVEKAKQASGDAEAALKVQDEFNSKYDKVLDKFWQSHQAVLLIDEYCVKINKVLLYSETQNTKTTPVYEKKFFNLGKFKIVNLDVENYESCPYRLIIEVNRRCILRKWFGLNQQE